MSADLKKLGLILAGGLIIFLVLLIVGCGAPPAAPAPASIATDPTATLVAPTRVPPTATAAPPPPAPVPPPAFNFPKATTWTYQGLVKWDEKGKAQQKTLTWQMHIADKFERGDGMVAYVMRGHPRDLAFYDAAKKPSDYLYLARAHRVYQITLIDAQPLARIKDKNDALADWLDDENLAFDFPLAVNKQFGPAQFLNDPGAGKYIWRVAEAKPTKLAGIQGVAPADATEYKLIYATNPDWQNLYYVPSVGITRLVYHHNGTVSDFDVKLIEYAAGAKP